ncbi:Uncharacterised protein [Escherichia coli]|nr:hypothetical protein Eco16F5M1D1_2618 [Escherichia coli O8:H8]SQK48001.1 Uncharacterised protein [Escherichia coli]
MERCQICNKYTGLPKPIGLGEKCDFTIITVKGRTTRHRVVTGKLNRTWAGGGYSVLYRGTLYRIDLITHPDDPSPISLAMIGRCSCAK